MWPFKPRPALSPAENARLYASRKWHFFLESRAFPDDVPLSARVAMFTQKYLPELAANDPRLKQMGNEDLSALLHDGIIASGLTTPHELDAALPRKPEVSP